MKYKGYYQQVQKWVFKGKSTPAISSYFGFKSQVCSRLKGYHTEHLSVLMVSSVHFSF